MARLGCIAVAILFALTATIVAGANSSLPELQQRSVFSTNALQFTYPKNSTLSNSDAGVTYSMDLVSNPILATLPGPGLSGKVDVFQPCSLKVPHVHPRATKTSYVVAGTLQVGIAEEDTGRVLDFNLTTGQSIIVPQGLLHYMKNNQCNQTLTMLTVFNNVDPGELVMLDKILAFPDATVRASSGLDQATIDAFRAKLPTGPGDLRIDTGHYPQLSTLVFEPDSESDPVEDFDAEIVQGWHQLRRLELCYFHGLDLTELPTSVEQLRLISVLLQDEEEDEVEYLQVPPQLNLQLLEFDTWELGEPIFPVSLFNLSFTPALYGPEGFDRFPLTLDAIEQAVRDEPSHAFNCEVEQQQHLFLMLSRTLLA
ncbi:hypothetical protein WJX72_006281 [[Myrmecia] bisecta]|uniref:Cupin type-1 domain-containing protein n=1 Tax=[Myrmecia] bisecta TaxID=41462 RepID=A0AAW1Q4G0_9CHLO